MANSDSQLTIHHSPLAINVEHQQLNLFPNFIPAQIIQPSLIMDTAALVEWKNQLYNHQQRQIKNPSPHQETLFPITQPHCDVDSIDPFRLKLQPSQFYRLKEQGDSICIYFVIDNALPIVLYIGETKRTPKQRWITHDCQQYILQYIDLHRLYDLPVQVATAFWWDTPQSRKNRLHLEKQLILKWRSPFNQENWHLWGQPFGKVAVNRQG